MNVFVCGKVFPDIITVTKISVVSVVVVVFNTFVNYLHTANNAA